MLQYYPQDNQRAQEKAAKVCLKICLVVCIAMLLIIFLGGFEFDSLCMMMCSVIMLVNYILYKSCYREERYLLTELEQFLGELRYQYSYCGRIDEALEECIFKQGELMSRQGSLILKCLSGDENEESGISNRFLSLLYILCKSIYIYGDSKRDGESVCLLGIGLIKETVEQEILLLDKKEHMFSGLLPVCMIPLLFIKVIEAWAVNNMEELKYYFEGSYGMITTLFLCAVSLLCFHIVRKMKYGLEMVPVSREWLDRLSEIKWVKKLTAWHLNCNYEKALLKHRRLKECSVREDAAQFIVLQYATALLAGIFACVGILSFYMVRRNQIVLQAEKMIGEIYQVQDIQQEKLREEVGLVVTGKNSDDRLEKIIEKCPEEMAGTLRNSVNQSASEWKKWRLPSYIWIMPFLVMIIAYHMRYKLIGVKKYFNGMKSEEEIIGYQMIIIFLMNLEFISAEEIMQWLENYAFYFKESVSTILYMLEYQNYESVGDMVEEEPYLPLRRILESVNACDRLKVQEAFGQMGADYNYSVRKYEQERRNYAKDQSAVGRVIAFIPLYLTIGMKLIVPFVLEGISKLSVYTENMKHFMN